MGEEGLEQTPGTSRKPTDSECGGAESGAIAPNGEVEDLNALWPHLNEQVRQAILTLVQLTGSLSESPQRDRR
jgi:hypothetical protein